MSGTKTNYGNDISTWGGCSFSKAFVIISYRDYYNVGPISWFQGWSTNRMYGFDVSSANFKDEDNIIIIVDVME
jgi:hypothetical protein